MPSCLVIHFVLLEKMIFCVYCASDNKYRVLACRLFHDLYKCWNLLLTLLLHDANKFSVLWYLLDVALFSLFAYVASQIKIFPSNDLFYSTYLLLFTHTIYLIFFIISHIIMIHEYINPFHEKKRKKVENIFSCSKYFFQYSSCL